MHIDTFAYSGFSVPYAEMNKSVIKILKIYN